MPIDNLYQHFLDFLSPIFSLKNIDTSEENIQARIRGVILMGISNKLNYLVLSTGNKSELATGYVTLYGDMVGGLCVLGDVFKTQVYKLSKWINRQNKKNIIPENIIKKPPSAELKYNQKDSDELPPYDILDKILIEHLENHLKINEIVKKYNFSKKIVIDVIKKTYKAEFKRRQGPLSLIVSKKPFGKGRIFPIAQGWQNK